MYYLPSYDIISFSYTQFTREDFITFKIKRKYMMTFNTNYIHLHILGWYWISSLEICTLKPLILNPNKDPVVGFTNFNDE